MGVATIASAGKSIIGGSSPCLGESLLLVLAGLQGIRGQSTYPNSNWPSNTLARAFGPRLSGRNRRPEYFSASSTKVSFPAGRPVRVASRILSHVARSVNPSSKTFRQVSKVQRLRHSVKSNKPVGSRPPRCAAALDHGHSSAAAANPHHLESVSYSPFPRLPEDDHRFAKNIFALILKNLTTKSPFPTP
jgi:hypothetical protein